MQVWSEYHDYFMWICPYSYRSAVVFLLCPPSTPERSADGEIGTPHPMHFKSPELGIFSCFPDLLLALDPWVSLCRHGVINIVIYALFRLDGTTRQICSHGETNCLKFGCTAYVLQRQLIWLVKGWRFYITKNTIRAVRGAVHDMICRWLGL